MPRLALPSPPSGNRKRNVTLAAWILTSWLCAGPGVAGECAPQPDESYGDRRTCLAAARLAQAGMGRAVVRRVELLKKSGAT